MRFLVRLGLLEAVGGIGEVGAAILQVVVEKQAIEVVADIIMVSDIAPRGFGVVASKQVEQALLALVERFAPAVLVFPAIGSDHQPQKVENVAVLDRQAPVHKGLADPDSRIAGDIERDFAVRQPNLERWTAAGPEAALAAVGKGHRQPPLADQLANQCVDHRHRKLLEPPRCGGSGGVVQDRRFALALSGGLELAAGGVDIAPARSPHRC